MPMQTRYTTQDLLDSIRRVRDEASSSNLTPFQIDYINTSLSSLASLVNSLEAQYAEVRSPIPIDVFNSLARVILKFEGLIEGADSKAKISSVSSTRSDHSQPKTVDATRTFDTRTKTFDDTAKTSDTTHNSFNDNTFNTMDAIDIEKRTSRRGSSMFNSPVKNSFSRSSSVSKATITKENVLREPIAHETFNFLSFATPGLNQQLHGIFKPDKEFNHVGDISEFSQSSNVFLD